MIEPMFRTERLMARHFEPRDLDDFAALCADPVVMRFVGDGSTLGRDDVAYWIEVCQRKYADRGYGTSAVFELSSGEFVGYCGVVRAPERDYDELVYVFHQRFWGLGYATEIGRAMLDYVFAISPLDAIAATIDPDNAASRRVAAKLGMTEQPHAGAGPGEDERPHAGKLGMTKQPHADKLGMTKQPRAGAGPGEDEPAVRYVLTRV
ncbi:MAG TPA: GNAT family N-acetyltransferase [Candidatus Limnocylindrales bacterium]